LISLELKFKPEPAISSDQALNFTQENKMAANRTNTDMLILEIFELNEAKQTT